jgi:hypothetical protein
MFNTQQLNIIQKINYFNSILDKLLDAMDYDEQFLIEYEKFKINLIDYSTETKSKFIPEKMDQFPEVTRKDITEFLSNKKSNGARSSLILVAVKLIRRGIEKPTSLPILIEHLQKDLDSIAHVIEHPGFEDMYYDAKISSD